MYPNPYYGLPGFPVRTTARPRPPRPTQPLAQGQRRGWCTHLDGDARLGEWVAAPLGRQGRPLLAEIERYLEFFAIAGAEPDQPRAA